MKNVTLSLPEETARWARIEAAKADKSLSKWVGEYLEAGRKKDAAYEKAVASLLSRKPMQLKKPEESYSKREDLYDRPVFHRHQSPSVLAGHE